MKNASQNSWNFPSKENLMPIYELPDPFLKPDGSRISSPEEWNSHRNYLKAMLSHYMYGTIPPAPSNTQGELLYSRNIYNGAAIAETVRITFGPDSQPDRKISMIVHITRPNRKERVPVITWNQFRGRYGCPIEEELVCQRGYAIAEYNKEELATDSPNAMKGPLALAYPGYTWGAIAMWSWGHSRIIDYLEQTEFADMDKIVATGHSRGGKAALCASVFDERIALCAANGSGCGGAGCLRYLGSRLGENNGCCETAGSIFDVFPFWWNEEFGRYGNRQTNITHATMLSCNFEEHLSKINRNHLGTTSDEFLLPFDLHFIKALIAPRAIITTDALGDTWANPYGTQITWMAADEVFHFLHAAGKNALHIREGGHAYLENDWKAVADFCDLIFWNKTASSPLLTTSIPIETDNELPHPAVSSIVWCQNRQHYTWCRP